MCIANHLIDRDVRAASRDVFIPTGDKSNSAEAGMHKPEGGKYPIPPYKSQYIYILYISAVKVKVLITR